MSKADALSRRTFLKVSAVAGGGFVLGCYAPALRAWEGTGKKAEGASALFEPNAFVQIDSNGDVTITVSKPEIGQGVRTSLAMIVAEELGVDWAKVKVAQAPGDSSKYGRQGVGGSTSVRSLFGPLRLAGATACLMLRQAAAERWKLPLAECTVRDGQVMNGTHRATFGELAADAARQPVPSGNEVPLKQPSQFTLIGKPVKRVDNPLVVKGKAQFGLDVKVPAMKVATIAKPDAFGGRAASFDDSEAKKVRGVSQVIEFGGGVAVIAEDTWSALKGREALKVSWDRGPNAGLTSEEISRRMREAVTEFPALPTGASRTVSAEYELPYLSHACMEPQNATAHVHDGKCEVWAPTQSPDTAREVIARQLGISPANVTFTPTLAGGGFGRRGSTDAIMEAVRLSQIAGCPIQLIWTREDDMKHDFYRPATFHAMRGALGSDGMPAAWHHQSIVSGGGRGGWRQAGIPYGIPDAQVTVIGLNLPIPLGPWRSVDNTFLGFVNECFVDELAHAAGKDPVEFRLALLRNDRLKRTLEVCAEKANWPKPSATGRALGVACFAGFGSFITQIAEVSMGNGGIPRVHRVVAAVDCGVAVNPLTIAAQIEGATVDGIACLLHAANTIEGGGVVETSFADFGWCVMGEEPIVETHIVASEQSPGGIGEVGYPAAAPSAANAIFRLTGKRVRKLPIGPGGLR